MPIHLSVSQVRKEIYTAAAGKSGNGEAQPSTLLLGRMFHEAFARLLGDDDSLNWRAAVANADPQKEDWGRLIQDHLYRRIIGPRLGREQVHLGQVTDQVRAFWQASKEMCRWVVDLLWTARKTSTKGEEPKVHLLLSPEEPLVLEIWEKGWTDSVTLTGTADLVLRIPGKSDWCIVELKLGRACPEADLAQVCLYHEILSSRRRGSAGALALVGFRPEKEERVFEIDELKDAQKRLISLIGRLAGVVPGRGPGERPSATDGPASASPGKTLKGYVAQGDELVAIFKEYGKEISIAGDPVAGPTFIRYPIRLGRGVKLNAAQTAAREVQHRLRLEAPPLVHLSEGLLVVDIQRPDRKDVPFSGIRDQIPRPVPGQGCSRILLGVDLNNTARFADLAQPENSHILVAGTAGSGKSEWLRSALASLLLTNTPETLRLVLIDPKRNAFNDMKASPFLLGPDALVYPDERPASDLIGRLIEEMERRYRVFHDAGADSLEHYVRKTRNPLPRIVSMCDEYFDLVSGEKKAREELESQIFRLGAKARAAGIHLIIATQHPSRQTIKGALDVNIPARVALKMTNYRESFMVLGQRGAENLLGKGDLLFKDIGDPVRLQSPCLPPEARAEILVSYQPGS